MLIATYERKKLKNVRPVVNDCVLAGLLRSIKRDMRKNPVEILHATPTVFRIAAETSEFVSGVPANCIFVSKSAKYTTAIMSRNTMEKRTVSCMSSRITPLEKAARDVAAITMTRITVIVIIFVNDVDDK